MTDADEKRVTLQSYSDGWRRGAANKPVPQLRAGEPQFLRGWQDGARARLAAFDLEREKLGIATDELVGTMLVAPAQTAAPTGGVEVEDALAIGRAIRDGKFRR